MSIHRNSSPHQIAVPQDHSCLRDSNEEGFGTDNEVSYPDMSVHRTSPPRQSNISQDNVPEGSSIMNKISMLLGANFPDDSKLLANPKGIIKSYLPIAAAAEPDKFDSYRKLCMAHVNEYYRHQKGDVGAMCLVCSAPCQHWNTLQRHLQTHINFRPFACDSCGRTFYSQSKLKRHQVIHNEVKPYKCPVCERRLGRTEHLKRHLLVHTDSKPYGCSGCSHTTKRLDGIRRHIKRKHGADGAKIISLEIPIESQMLNNLRQAISVSETSEPKLTPKPKKKKKKKKAGANQGLLEQDPNPKDMIGNNIIDVAAGFGVRDLRLPSALEHGQMSEQDQSKDMKPRFQSCGQKMGTDLSGDKKTVWDNRILMPSHSMHILYQTLARSHPAASGHHIRDGNSSATSASAASGPSQSFQSDAANLSQSEDVFAMNSSTGSGQMRYLPSVSNAGEGTSRNINPMLLSPGSTNGTIGHYAHPDIGGIPAEMMISQYFQSHQRFAPPVWGFANPNYPNY